MSAKLTYAQSVLEFEEGKQICQKPKFNRLSKYASTAAYGQVVGASTQAALHSGLIPSRVKPMTIKLAFTASLLDAQL